jgi:PAS domain S-box-containing protein
MNAERSPAGERSALDAARVRRLWQSTPANAGASAVAGLVVLGLLLPGPAAGRAWAWLGLLGAVLALRLAWWWRSHNRLALAGTRDAAPALRQARRLFALHGFVWAALLAVLQPLPPPEALGGVLFVWTAMVGGALVMGAPDQRAAAWFAGPAGLALMAALLGVLGRPLPALAVGAATLLLMVAAAGRRAALQFEAEWRALQAAEQRSNETQRHADDAERARRELARQHALTQQLLRGTSQGYWFVAPDGRTLDVNPAMCQMLGRSREELLSLSAAEVFSGAARERLQRELARRREGHSGSYALSFERPDGSVCHAINQATPIVDDDGHHIGSIGLWTDLTEQTARERALHVHERVVNSVDDMVSVIDADGRYTLVNDAWCRMLGHRREAVLGQPARPLLQAMVSDTREAVFQACRREGRPGVVTTPTRLPDGRDVVLQTHFFPYRGEHGEGAGSVILVSRDIRHQEQDRAAAEVAAETLRRVLDATGDAIYAIDSDAIDGPLRLANQQLLDLAGIHDRAPHELTLADLRRAAAHLYADPEVEERQTAAIAASGQRHEGLLKLRDGRVLYRRFEPASVGGRRLRVWSLRDVTAEQRALTLLHDREAELRALLDAFPGLISRFDSRLHYTYVNEPLARQAGRPAAELVGRPVSEVIGRRRAAAFAELARQVQPGQPVNIEREYSGPNGTVTVQMTLAAGTDPLSGERTLYAFGIDISGLKRAEQQLRDREHELRTLLAAFPGYISSVDDDGRYTFINAELARLLGRRPEDVVGRTMTEVLGPERAAQIAREHEQAREGRTVEVERSYADGAGGEAHLSIRHVAGARRADGRSPVYTFSLDTTAARAASRALAAARDAADRANQAKSQFLSHVSHELRTPMHAIIGFAQVLLRGLEPPLPPVAAGHVQQILGGAEHLLQLVGEMLDLGRIEADRLALEPAAVDTVALVAECHGLVSEMARGRGVALAAPPHAAGLPAVWADRTRLRQVLLNLLSNAIKYTQPAGAVAVRLQAEAGQLLIEVCDNGPGIAPEAQRRLFQPFERLGAERGPVEGAGIGLALSQRLVQAMGGQIGVHSAPGQGSVFWVRLPLARGGGPAPARPDAGLAPPAPAAPATVPMGTTPVAAAPAPSVPPVPLRRVLCIDDNEVNLELLRAMLGRMPGLQLSTYSRPAEGLAAALAQPPDLVLLDIQMPLMDGHEVLRRLKADARTAAVPVVALSADATPAEMDAARASGFVEYVTKPVALEGLQRVVSRWAWREEGARG